MIRNSQLEVSQDLNMKGRIEGGLEEIGCRGVTEKKTKTFMVLSFLFAHLFWIQR